MKILFIRHGDPDYSIDSLTEKGWREAKLLADRITRLDITDFYCSPLGRAKDTASLTLNALHRTAETLPWIEEFIVRVTDPLDSSNQRIPWDFMPRYWTEVPALYEKTDWVNAPVMQTGDIKNAFDRVRNGMDALLARYGYHRFGNYYKTDCGCTDTIAIFCHLGSQFVALSHLLGISAPALWQGFFVAPSSVTVLCTEEREKGIAYFRCKQLGDTSHLYVAGEPSSDSGFFEETYQEK